jgi:hypothetical protein
MTHTDARAALARAETPVERKKALIAAMDAGVPLREIEEDMDWADEVRAHRHQAPKHRAKSLFDYLIRLCGFRPQRG